MNANKLLGFALQFLNWIVCLVGFEALNTIILRGRFCNDAKEDVIFPEGVHRCSVTREVVNHLKIPKSVLAKDG